MRNAIFLLFVLIFRVDSRGFYSVLFGKKKNLNNDETYNFQYLRIA